MGEEENLIDFLEDPVAFIQNGFDLDTYLSELTINETNISKLKRLMFSYYTSIQIKHL